MLPITERRDRLQGFERFCREHGLALTVQRREVFAAMLERRDHPTAEQIYAAVKERVPGVSRTTVYRVLETLVGAGVITKACHPGAAARYDPLTRRHHHLVCLGCDKIVDLEDPRLDRLPMPRVRKRGFKIGDYCIHFTGLCAGCRAKLGGTRRVTGRRRQPGRKRAGNRLRKARRTQRRKTR